MVAAPSTSVSSRPRLDGGDPETRVRRLDLFFAGDQRHRFGADPLHRAVINFARQQPQRQADEAGRMRQHPLDREMRLAGIGRTQHGCDAGTTGTQITVGGRRERNRHQKPGLTPSLSPPLARGAGGDCLLYHNVTRGKSCA
jgi:hypothetical protein